MNLRQQAYIGGFVKRAGEYGLNENESMDLLKQAMTDKEKLEKALAEEELSPVLNALGQGIIAPFNHLYHGYKDFTKEDFNMPFRTPRIFGGAALGGLLGGIGAKAFKGNLLSVRDASRFGSMGGAALGTSKYNEDKQKYIEELKKRIDAEKN